MPAHRRRDRRGRGLRGPLLPPDVPGSRSRAEAFDDVVLDAVEHLEARWASALVGVEFAVEEVPPAPDRLVPGTTFDEEADDAVPLARTVAGRGTGRHALPTRVILHRRPIEARAHGREDLADLVLDIVIHEVARLLGVDPSVIDPEGHSPGGADGYDED